MVLGVGKISCFVIFHEEVIVFVCFYFQKAVCEHLWKLAEGLQYQHICGIPYQGIPIATVTILLIWLHTSIPPIPITT